jgi:FSR family fosmidomycin resistance protein-like MFS transporter
MTLIAYSIAHFLTDAVCASAIFSSQEMIPYILMYDLLAFSTQGITGIMADVIKRYRYIAIAGGLMTALAALLPIPVALKVCLIGIGNSTFHVGGGAAVLKGSSNKATPLGIFVAPGSMGLLLGMLFPSIMIYVSIALLLISIGLIWMKEYQSIEPSKDSSTFSMSGMNKKVYTLIIIAIILISVSVRSMASYSISYPWKNTITLSILLGVFVMMGKAAGGFILDKIKAVPVIILSVLISGPVIAFLSSSILPSLVGQFLINCSMPLTLYMLYRMLPDYPGFAFGLAASFLFPGMAVGLGLQLSNFIILLIFMSNAILLYIAVKIMKKGSINV